MSVDIKRYKGWIYEPVQRFDNQFYWAIEASNYVIRNGYKKPLFINVKAGTEEEVIQKFKAEVDKLVKQYRSLG